MTSKGEQSNHLGIAALVGLVALVGLAGLAVLVLGGLDPAARHRTIGGAGEQLAGLQLLLDGCKLEKGRIKDDAKVKECIDDGLPFLGFTVRYAVARIDQLGRPVIHLRTAAERQTSLWEDLAQSMGREMVLYARAGPLYVFSVDDAAWVDGMLQIPVYPRADGSPGDDVVLLLSQLRGP